MSDRPSCFGRFFLTLPNSNITHREKARCSPFDSKAWGMFVQRRSLSVDAAAWDACQPYSCYRSCYDLSVAQFLLMQAVESR